MKKSEKIIATIGAIIGFFIVAGIIQAAIVNNGGGGRGIIGLMFLGVIYGIRSIWKSKKSENNSDDLPMKP